MLSQQRDIKTLQKDMRTQQAKSLGPTLGEFYGQWLGLTGLRGLWYPGSLDQTGTMYDKSNEGRTLTYNGNPTLNVYNDLVPYMDYDGTGDYHSRADEAGLDILGNETTIVSSLRGLTFGGWFWWNNPAGGTTQTIISKAQPGDISWYIRSNTSGDLVLAVSNTGVALLTTTIASVPVAGWVFAVGRYTPSNEIKLWLNDSTSTNSTSIPATLKNSGARFLIAGEDNGIGGVSNPLTGRMAVAFVCAALLSDQLIRDLYNRSRPLFGI